MGVHGVDKRVLGKACHYARYHVTKTQNVFVSINKPYTFLDPTNNAHFFVNVYYIEIVNKTGKEPPVKL